MHAIAAQERMEMVRWYMTDSRIGVGASPGQDGGTINDQIASSDQPTTDGWVTAVDNDGAPSGRQDNTM